MANNRNCVLCGTSYEFCNKCNKNKPMPWKNIYCSENCRDITDIVQSYKAGKFDKNQAKNKLGSYSMPINFNDWARGTIAEILGDTTVAPIEESVVEAINEVPLENVLSASEIEEVLDSTEEVTEEPVQGAQEVDQKTEQVVEETTSHKSRKHK